jgi:2-succinyl-5-enolpyruvyl-6-hydroxy-3-cyclohexene-1-carboxylate synthase
MVQQHSDGATFCATLVDEWIALGLKHAVVAPGSRSTPLAVALAGRYEIDVHVFHDERSAAFCALGIGIATGIPAVVLCTSGTAATHFHAAVVEAGLSLVPMIVCTADRPPELHGVGAPQTIDQQRLYGSAVRSFVNVEPQNSVDAPSWRGIASSAWSTALASHNPGPVHLNLGFREPLVGTAGDLPPRNEESIASDVQVLPDPSIATLLSSTRGVVVAGEGIADFDVVGEWLGRLGWPVIADPRSGLRVLEDRLPHAPIISAADPILRSALMQEGLRPDVVLRIGEPPVSKVVNAWLAQSKASYVAISRRPVVTDPDRVVSHAAIGPIEESLTAIGHVVGCSDDEWIASWVAAETIARTVIDESMVGATLHEAKVAHLLVDQLGDDTALVVSSSMPVRDVEWFGGRRNDLRVLSNRGANGIDGVVATSIGVALGSREPVTILIGDIALVHDSSSLVNIVDHAVDLHIVLIDNRGGGIFSFLPQAEALETDQFEKLFGTPHSTDFASLCRAHGIEYHEVESEEQLIEVSLRDGVRLSHVRTDRPRNVEIHRELNDAVVSALEAAFATGG